MGQDTTKYINSSCNTCGLPKKRILTPLHHFLLSAFNPRKMSTTTEFLTASNDTLATQSSGYAPTTHTSKFSKCFVDDLVIVKVARFMVYSVILLTSLVANSMTVFLIWKKKRMRKTVNYFIVNMAVSDLLITTVYMPRQMIKFFIGPQWNVGGDFGAVLCKVVPSLHVIAVLASILTLLAISMDRFFVVVFPMKIMFNEIRVKMAVTLIWLLSIAARVPYFYALEIKGSIALYILTRTLGSEQETYTPCLF